MIVRGNAIDAKKLFEVSKTQSGNRITKLLHPQMNEKNKEEKKDNKKEVSNSCVSIIIVVIMYSPHSLHFFMYTHIHWCSTFEINESVNAISFWKFIRMPLGSQKMVVYLLY
mgnify:CR=1 FL=1